MYTLKNDLLKEIKNIFLKSSLEGRKDIIETEDNCISYHEEKVDEDMGRGKGKLGQSERVAWTNIHYQM